VTGTGAVDLYWIPVGAGDASPWVRRGSRAYESVVARLRRRPVCDLFHSALVVHTAGGRFVVEMAPVWADRHPQRGVVTEGPVGSPWLGRSAMFRYEVRRWRDGLLQDAAEAVESPLRLSTDATYARRLLDLVPRCPTYTWGRDEAGTGDMWNSNSLVSWLLAVSGQDVDRLQPPRGGRAPGWTAGLAVAARSLPRRAQQESSTT
jgi:hypothetical protein